MHRTLCIILSVVLVKVAPDLLLALQFSFCVAISRVPVHSKASCVLPELAGVEAQMQEVYPLREDSSLTTFRKMLSA